MLSNLDVARIGAEEVDRAPSTSTRAEAVLEERAQAVLDERVRGDARITEDIATKIERDVVRISSKRHRAQRFECEDSTELELTEVALTIGHGRSTCATRITVITQGRSVPGEDT